MHKISLIFSGIAFLLGCITLGVAIFLSDISVIVKNLNNFTMKVP